MGPALPSRFSIAPMVRKARQSANIPVALPVVRPRLTVALLNGRFSFC